MSNEELVKNYLLMCGTCKYKQNGRCQNMDSDCCDGIVVDECSCNEYIPRKDLQMKLIQE